MEYSQWNKCANIPEDEFSLESRDYYQRAINIYKHQVLIELMGWKK